MKWTQGQRQEQNKDDPVVVLIYTSLATIKQEGQEVSIQMKQGRTKS